MHVSQRRLPVAFKCCECSTPQYLTYVPGCPTPLVELAAGGARSSGTYLHPLGQYSPPPPPPPPTNFETCLQPCMRSQWPANVSTLPLHSVNSSAISQNPFHSNTQGCILTIGRIVYILSQVDNCISVHLHRYILSSAVI